MEKCCINISSPHLSFILYPPISLNWNNNFAPRRSFCCACNPMPMLVAKYQLLPWAMAMSSLKNIMGIAVCKDYQHQGIGRKLLYAVEKWARETHAAGVRLVSGETRTEAHQFYQICGYAANKKLMHFMKLFNDDKNQ